MPIIDYVLDSAVLLARQATTGTIATSPTTNAAGTGATVAATTTASSPTGTATASSTTTAGGGANTGGGGGGGSSPLLFFIALGFGVVFTNLWIIVGVKYCFRYNARARRLRMAVEDGEPITLENMPHPRRRRREKKLMTMDEVNEKFPMLKYKTWVASRAEKGLPTAGGVNAPTRPNSIRSVDAAIAPLENSATPQRDTSAKDSKSSNDKQHPNASTAQLGDSAATNDSAAVNSATAGASVPSDETRHDVTSAAADNRASIVSADEDTGLGVHNKLATDEHHHLDDDDDERIDPALPPECVGTSGDTCAICIDTLEDDDDVRGLTCGHAFHAVCLDPWLTSRRACCPLCKADYYTPKPRPPPGETAGAGHDQVDAAEMERRRMNLALYSAGGWRTGRMLPGRFVLGPRNANTLGRDPFFPQGRAQNTRANTEASAVVGTSQDQTTPQVQQPAATHANWIGNLRPFRRWNGQSSQRTGQADAATSVPEVTPSQLEAGTQAQTQ
ncbi:hypothetical protein SEPCBS119000_005839 [Sporothrix epigloea]|uniref:RING-type domain-containing protein n=1 Tax=Sporothrix epigloea TaxID=1892477 RepID=A0ABP0DZT0_9PEZI